MKQLLFVGLAALILVSCGKSKTPDNEIISVETVHGGFIPDPAGTMFKPIEVIDTLVTLQPTWGQANYFASKRGDFLVWQIIAIVLLLIGGALLYGYIFSAKWLPKLSGKLHTLIVFVCLCGALASWKWQAGSIKWNNEKQIPKSYYDRLMNDTGSTKAVWDSLETNCLISWGPYECYK